MVYVKICGITRREDALEAARCGADAIGFVFAPGSPRRVSPERAGRIAEAVAGSLVCVGVFLDQPAEEVNRISDRVGLDHLQFHGRETPEYCRRFGNRWYKAFRLTPAFSAGSIADYGGWCFLLDGLFRTAPPGGASRDSGSPAWDWDRIRAVARRGKMVLAGGLTPDNVAEAIRRVRPYGVDVCRGVEVRPGEKGAGLMRSFVERARRAGRGVG